MTWSSAFRGVLALGSVLVMVSSCVSLDEPRVEGMGGAPSLEEGAPEVALGGSAGSAPTWPPFGPGDCLAEGGPRQNVTSSGIGTFRDNPNWLDGWTNFSPDSTPEDEEADDKEVVLVESDIEVDTVWTADNVYVLSGWDIHVVEGVELTIQPGTVIRSSGTNLIVSRGGKLFAEGTRDAPIVFTSTDRNGKKRRDSWGGLAILGRAPNWHGNMHVEGLPHETGNFHGGHDPNDSSGILQYVRFEFGGTYTPAEIGLSLLSVGAGTVISHVQVHSAARDGVRFYGGTVNADHLVVSGVADEAVDLDVGYQGDLDYVFVRHDNPGYESQGMEWDGNRDDPARPRNTEAHARHLTLCGVEETEPLFHPTYGLRLRENVRGSLDDLVIVGFNAAVDVEGPDEGGAWQEEHIELTNALAWGQSGPPADENADGDDDGGFDEVAWVEGAGPE